MEKPGQNRAFFPERPLSHIYRGLAPAWISLHYFFVDCGNENGNGDRDSQKPVKGRKHVAPRAPTEARPQQD